MLFDPTASISLVLFAIWMGKADSRRHTIYWDSNIKQELKTEYKLDVYVNDWMDILCPHKASYNQSSLDTSVLYLEIYNVSAEHYKHCTTRGQKRLLHCRDPRQEIKLTTKFQTRSPSPIGFVFKPGSSYYYISKPTQKRSSRGCRDTMRMAVTVHDKTSRIPSRNEFISDVKDERVFPPPNRKHHNEEPEHPSKPEVIIVPPLASRNPAPSTDEKDPGNSSLSALKGTTVQKLTILSLCISITAWLTGKTLCA